MLTSIKISNFKTFAEEVSIDLNAVGSIKRFQCNTLERDSGDILKTIGIYGPNNTGKTCFILALANLRKLMLNEPREVDLSNSFSKDNVVKYEVEYCIDNRNYKYVLHYDCKKFDYVKEILSTVTISDSNKSVKTYTELFNKTSTLHKLKGATSQFLLSIRQLVSNKYPFVMMMNFATDSQLNQAKKDYIEFANSIELLMTYKSIDVSKTINIMQKDKEGRKFIEEFVKNCDLHIEEFGYSDQVYSDVDITEQLNTVGANRDFLKLYSKHNGFRVPSFFFDSVGTRKIVCIAGYVYEAIKKGKILLIDEIDSSLHHIISRALISIFNNDLNKKAQLIFSTHDALLMDLKHLMRKDQIYLTDINKENNVATLFHLSDISSKDDNGIRGDEDIVGHYLKGRFGSIPTPDLFDALWEITDGNK